MSQALYQRLWLDPDNREVFLLGYPLRLTNTEYALLLCIASSEDAGVSHDTLSEICDQSSITTHLSNINQKASELSDRRLIVYIDQKYKIHENM